jgi:hypothetical protein
MNGITEFAKILKGCENPLPFSPAFGTIKNLPDLKIQTESNIVLSKTQITSVFDVRKKDDNGNYIYLNFSTSAWNDGSFMATIMLAIIFISMAVTGTFSNKKETRKGGDLW